MVVRRSTCGMGLGGIDLAKVASEANSRCALDQVNSPAARLAGVRALLPLSGGQLLSAGSDRTIRYWEPAWPERSYVVAAPVWPAGAAVVDAGEGLLQVRRGVAMGCRLCPDSTAVLT